MARRTEESQLRDLTQCLQQTATTTQLEKMHFSRNEQKEIERDFFLKETRQEERRSDKERKKEKNNHKGHFQHFRFKVCAMKRTCIIWRDRSVAEVQQTLQVAEVFDVAW